MTHDRDARRLRRSPSAQLVVIGAAGLLLRVVLDLVYVIYVDRFFSGSLGAGVVALTEVDPVRVLESYFVVCILNAWLALSLARRPRPTGIVLFLYMTVVLVPLSSLYGLAGAPREFFYAAAASFACLLAVGGLVPRAKVRRPGPDLLFLGLTAVIGISVYVYGWLALTGGLARFNLDLLAVYGVRAQYAQQRGLLLGYLIPWQAHVVNPIILCYGLHKRRLWVVGGSVLAQLALFGVTGHRAFLLAPLLAGGVYFLWSRRNALLYLTAGAVAAIVGSYCLFLLTGDHLAPSVLIRRLFFVPAANHVIYYDFFSRPENPFIMLSNSILAPLLQYPYDMAVTRVISWTYWGSDFAPNVGYLGDAFAHFGFMGMVLFSIILGLFLRVVDSVGARLPPRFVAAVMATPAIAVINSALFTSLLTHGMIPALVLLWLARPLVERGARGRAEEKNRGRSTWRRAGASADCSVTGGLERAGPPDA